jgi:hypothetical protein
MSIDEYSENLQQSSKHERPTFSPSPLLSLHRSFTPIFVVVHLSLYRPEPEPATSNPLDSLLRSPSAPPELAPVEAHTFSSGTTS